MTYFPNLRRPAERMPVFAPDDMLVRDAWSGSDDQQICLEAIVIDNNIEGSDPTLLVRAPDGTNWTIELASRSRNVAAGLTHAQALPGDRVMVIGRNLSHFGEDRIKALNLTIADRTFVLSSETITPA